MKTKFTYLLMVVLALAVSLTFTSCGGDDEGDKPSKSEAMVKVTNKSTVTLRDLIVVHLNDDNEPVKQETIGDVAPDETITFKSESAKIYFGLRFTDGNRVTANYSLTMGQIKEIILDGSTVWMK